jgi:signal transduction histidine kinase
MVGRYASAVAFAAGVGICVIYAVVHETLSAAYVLSGEHVTLWLVLLGPGLLGLVLRSQALETTELERQADRIRAESQARRDDALARERARIALELHDVLGHNVSLLVLQLVAAQTSLEAGDVQATAARLTGLEEIARTTLGELRGLGLGAGLSPQPGVADLPDLIASATAAGVTVEYSADPLPAVPAGLGLAVYRVVQEALTNVVRHAQAPCIVAVGARGAELTVEVTDDGRGVEASRPGRGLIGMRERVTLHGGRLDAGPVPGGGFRVHATFPLGGLR